MELELGRLASPRLHTLRVRACWSCNCRTLEMHAQDALARARCAEQAAVGGCLHSLFIRKLEASTRNPLHPCSNVKPSSLHAVAAGNEQHQGLFEGPAARSISSVSSVIMNYATCDPRPSASIHLVVDAPPTPPAPWATKLSAPTLILPPHARAPLLIIPIKAHAAPKTDLGRFLTPTIIAALGPAERQAALGSRLSARPWRRRHTHLDRPEDGPPLVTSHGRKPRADETRVPPARGRACA